VTSTKDEGNQTITYEKSRERSDEEGEGEMDTLDDECKIEEVESLDERFEGSTLDDEDDDKNNESEGCKDAIIAMAGISGRAEEEVVELDDLTSCLLRSRASS